MKLSTGRNGWVLLAVGVLAWDVLLEDSLSEAFSRAVHNKRYGPALITTWVVLTAHLFDILPVNLDPFHLFLKGAKHLQPHSPRGVLG